MASCTRTRFRHFYKIHFRFLLTPWQRWMFRVLFLSTISIAVVNANTAFSANDSSQFWSAVVIADDSTAVTASLSKLLRQTIREHDSMLLRTSVKDHHLKFVLQTSQTNNPDHSSTVRLSLMSYLVVRDRIKYRNIVRRINVNVASCNMQFLYICKAGLEQRVDMAVQAANESTPLIKYIENGKWK